MGTSTAKKGVSLLWALGFGSCSVLMFGAIAGPKFLTFQQRSKQGEAKAYLKQLFNAEQAYFQEKDTYSADAQQLNTRLDRGNRYAYFLAERGAVERRDQAGAPLAVDGGTFGFSNDTLARGGEPGSRSRRCTAR